MARTRQHPIATWLVLPGLSTTDLLKGMQMSEDEHTSTERPEASLIIIGKAYAECGNCHNEHIPAPAHTPSSEVLCQHCGALLTHLLPTFKPTSGQAARFAKLYHVQYNGKTATPEDLHLRS